MPRRLLFLGAVGLVWSMPSTPALAAPIDADLQWGRLQGLMAGVTVMHGVQPVGAWAGAWDWKSKHYVAVAGTVLYGTTFVGNLAEARWSLYPAIIGPAVGLSTVLSLTALDALGVTDSGVKPDVMQIAGGLLQLPAALIAFDLLRREELGAGGGSGSDPARDARAWTLPIASGRF